MEIKGVVAHDFSIVNIDCLFYKTMFILILNFFFLTWTRRLLLFIELHFKYCVIIDFSFPFFLKAFKISRKFLRTRLKFNSLDVTFIFFYLFFPFYDRIDIRYVIIFFLWILFGLVRRDFRSRIHRILFLFLLFIFIILLFLFFYNSRNRIINIRFIRKSSI